ncbi:hypothetical protein M758_5G078200 [Ceratodon purpureus]|nr:hypothetical protein M758_5G078200 [Ceratodon purpureus]
MVVFKNTKVTKRKRKQADWLGNDVYPLLDLTKDGDESDAVSISDFNSSEDGKRSSVKTVDSSSFDREILLGDQEEEDSLQFSSPTKDSPIAMDTCVEVDSQTNTEHENHSERGASQIVLPVESIQPPSKINCLYMKFSAQAIEIRGGDEESMIHEWPLENIVRIGIHYLSEEEVDTRAFVAVTVLVPLRSLSRSSKETDEYLLQLSKFRDSVVGILKLSPIFGSIIEELEKEDVEKTARTIKMQNTQASKSLFSSSSEELNEAVDAFKVLVYPQDDPDAVTITQKDIKILGHQKPLEFLNDTIIDFYIKYLQQTIVSSEKLKTLHFFNSFFYSKLAEVSGAASFERVKKWTRKVNIFEKDFVFIPVNQSLHWSLIIICHPGHIWEVPTIDGSSDGDACILHLDSMEGSHKGQSVDQHIRNYLFQEWIERNRDREEMSYAEVFFSGMPYMYLKIPQQGNNYDCGLFLLHYVELFLKQAPSVYRTRIQRNPPTEFLRRNWFKPSEASAKRRVIQKLIIELSQRRSLEGLGEYSNMKENSPDGVFSVNEQPTRVSAMPLHTEKRRAAQTIDELSPVQSNPLGEVKELLIENCSPVRSEAMELHVDLCEFSNPDRRDKHVKLRNLDGSTEASECDDIRRGMHYTTSDQPNASCKYRADQSSTHISVENDDLKSGPDPVVHFYDETLNHERCPVPRLSLQVKPLQVPSLIDEELQMFSQPPAAVDLRIQDGSETSDELSSSYFNEGAGRSQKERLLVDFDSILSPKQVNNFVTAGSDDEMYESSPFSANQRRSTSQLQHEVVSPVVGTPENVRFGPVRSPEPLETVLDSEFDEEVRTVESGRGPAKFKNSTHPFGRYSELNMQGALNHGKRKQSEDRDVTRRDNHQQCGSFVHSEEIQVIEELSSDDSSGSSKRWNFEKCSSERIAKRSSREVGQRVTRSKTQSSHGLPVSAEKQAKRDALDALCREKNCRKR